MQSRKRQEFAQAGEKPEPREYVFNLLRVWLLNVPCRSSYDFREPYLEKGWP